jgi:hypothetical protein
LLKHPAYKRKEAFRVNRTTRQKWLRRKRRIAKRLRPRRYRAQAKPMLTAKNIHYDMADRTRAIGCGGIGTLQLLVRKIKLAEAIDKALHLFKVHLPYHESDHVLNIAYNIICGGRCLQDLELLRNDEAHLDALGASRIPDPTTAGDFCRRFQTPQQVLTLMEAINSTRVEEVWKKQEASFFEKATIDVDGTIASTDAECKQGMDIGYDGQWGYLPLVVSLANTKEVLYLLNRPANRPSHENAAEYLDRAFDLCERTGFKSIVARGDTDFSQTAHLDRWNQRGVNFVFGMDASPTLKGLAQVVPQADWKELARPPRYEVATEQRQRPENVKEKIIAERLYKNLVLQCEHVAEIDYQPIKCAKTYRVVICRKTINVEVGQRKLWDEYRYFFFITNFARDDMPAAKVVLSANQRCDQENLIEQLKNGVKAMRLPVDTLISNWAYMVMATLAWNLKAWWGLMLPEAPGRGREKRRQQKREVVRMEFPRFVASLIRLPCQIIKSGRRLIYRLLSYSPWQEPLLAAAAAWRSRARC